LRQLLISGFAVCRATKTPTEEEKRFYIERWVRCRISRSEVRITSNIEDRIE
jgi:hypothetical protein